MSFRFAIRYHYAVDTQDVPRLFAEWRLRIQKAIETKLTTQPDIFGKPLRHSLAGCRKLRVGDYRIIFVIGRTEVIVWAIGHRRDIYNIVMKRIDRILK